MAVSFPSASADLFDFVFPGNSGTRASNTSPASPLPIARNCSARAWALLLPKTGTVPVTAATPGTPASDRTGEQRISAARSLPDEQTSTNRIWITAFFASFARICRHSAVGWPDADLRGVILPRHLWALPVRVRSHHRRLPVKVTNFSEA